MSFSECMQPLRLSIYCQKIKILTPDVGSKGLGDPQYLMQAAHKTILLGNGWRKSFQSYKFSALELVEMAVQEQN